MPICNYNPWVKFGSVFFLVRLDYCVSLFACASSHPLSIALFLTNVASTIIIIITPIMQKDPVLAYSYHLLLHYNETMSKQISFIAF